MSTNPETNSFKPEQERNPEALRQEREKQQDAIHERLNEQLEKGERSHENEGAARHEALEQATAMEQEAKQQDRLVSPAERRKAGPISKTARDASFTATMKEVRGQMSAPSRAFSKVIHNKAVEKVSDITAATVARPNAILTGSIFAFVLTLGVYLVAKNYGYTLSGVETIAAFALGWLLGLTYDFLKVMITGRK